MPSPLSAESVYNELSGEECRDILLSRFADILSRVPEFQRHITLPRVRMTLNVRLEIAGRNPPAFHVNDEVVLRLNTSSIPIDIDRVMEEEAEINADTLEGNGQPPDQIRDEHSLPVSVPTRTPQGIQDIPTVRGGEKYPHLTPALVGRTITITPDFGPARMRTGNEGIGMVSLLAEKNAHGGAPDLPITPEFREAIREGNESRRRG